MKKTLFILVCATMILSSCGTYMGSGTYVGAQVGTILGSAIGGISNGGRGSDVGTIIGMAGGAVIGGAIGNAKDKADRREVQEHYQQVQQQKAAAQVQEDDIFDPNGRGNDILYDFNGPDYTTNYSATEPLTGNEASFHSTANRGFNIGSRIEVRNARFVDDNRDNSISSNELSKIIFEVVNVSDETMYDLQPIVEETTSNKRIYVSPSVHVEALEPGKAIRYTAMVKAGKLKNGVAKFNIMVNEGRTRVSPIQEFNVVTKK